LADCESLYMVSSLQSPECATTREGKYVVMPQYLFLLLLIRLLLLLSILFWGVSGLVIFFYRKEQTHQITTIRSDLMCFVYKLQILYTDTDCFVIPCTILLLQATSIEIQQNQFITSIACNKFPRTAGFWMDSIITKTY
jgi:hypothetical protein